MVEKKIIIFNDKMFYNARHLFLYIEKYYMSVHHVDYLTIRNATGKRLKSIDKFYNVSYEMVSESHKQKIKRYMQISEGYEHIVAIDIKNFDDYIIHILSMKDIGYLYVFRNPKKQLVLCYKDIPLKKLASSYHEQLQDQLMTYVKQHSFKYDTNYYYYLNPSQIKQNIF
jgi:hypothetical protein